MDQLISTLKDFVSINLSVQLNNSWTQIGWKYTHYHFMLTISTKFYQNPRSRLRELVKTQKNYDYQTSKGHNSSKLLISNRKKIMHIITSCWLFLMSFLKIQWEFQKIGPEKLKQTKITVSPFQSFCVQRPVIMSKVWSTFSITPTYIQNILA